MQKEKTEYFKEQEEAVVAELKEQPLLYQQYLALNKEWRQRFLDFCTGKKTLPLTYDPFFKQIFHPDVHPKRLSQFIGSLIERDIKVIRILPTEENLYEEVLLVMDLLVELEDGSLANVEIQKIPYFFPAERMSCYSADLLLRQYSRLKGEKGKEFKYKDVKKVYTIVIFEKSGEVFHKGQQSYIHRGKTVFDTGLNLELLQEYCLVALDVFKKIPYAKNKKEQVAWLALLATENVEDALEVARRYPWLVEVYKEMADYMCRPKEVLNMFSEALHILDRNTVSYMIEEQQQQIENQKQQIESQKQQIEKQKREIEELKSRLNK